MSISISELLILKDLSTDDDRFEWTDHTFNPQWARDLRDQCQAAGVPFFFKQNGEYVSVSEVEGPGEHYTFPDFRTVRRVGKKKAGRTLDGREWSQFPEAKS